MWFVVKGIWSMYDQVGGHLDICGRMHHHIEICGASCIIFSKSQNPQNQLQSQCSLCPHAQTMSAYLEIAPTSISWGAWFTLICKWWKHQPWDNVHSSLCLMTKHTCHCLIMSVGHVSMPMSTGDIWYLACPYDSKHNFNREFQQPFGHFDTMFCPYGIIGVYHHM